MLRRASGESRSDFLIEKGPSSADVRTLPSEGALAQPPTWRYPATTVPPAGWDGSRSTSSRRCPQAIRALSKGRGGGGVPTRDRKRALCKPRDGARRHLMLTVVL